MSDHEHEHDHMHEHEHHHEHDHDCHHGHDHHHDHEHEADEETLIDEDGLYLYAFREEPGENEACVYDKSEMLVLILRTTDAEGNVEFNSWVGQDGKDDIVPTDSNASDTVVFTNIYPNLTIEKNWEIDLEKLDRPDSIQVAVQKKSGDEWVTVKLVELNGDKDWKAYVVLEGFDPENGEYRVRELKEETALQELGGKLLEYIGMGKDKYDEWLQLLKTEGKSYWDGMPDGAAQLCHGLCPHRL